MTSRFDPPAPRTVADRSVRLLREPGAAQERYQRDLTSAGVDIPLMHRAVWMQGDHTGPAWYLAVVDENGICRCGTGIEVIRRRALPGTLTLRVCRFGGARDDAAREAALKALADLAARSPRIVRLHVETYSLCGAVLAHAERTLATLGFRRADPARCYEETVTLDLRPSEEAILAGFHATARRHIRATHRHDVVVHALEDPGHGDGIRALVEQTMARTGGDVQAADWEQRIAFSRRHPELSRIVGLLRADASRPELLAFAWGCLHGATAQYATAASARPTDLRMPLGYALAWDLMRWAKAGGAECFDFGGITHGAHVDEDDALGGISDFKRYFSDHRRRVASEWILTPRPLLAGTGDLIARAAFRLRR